jgi:Zn-dependent peptidase ImmA (M78 family)
VTFVADRRIVPPLSAREVEQFADDARAHLGLAPDDRVSMTPLLEQVLYDYIDDYDFRVAEDREMGSLDGLTDSTRPIITLKNSVYHALQRGDHRARMTAAHEFGHLLLHCRVPVGYASSSRRDPLRDPERQADIFASAFLMPREAFVRCSTVAEVRRKFGVSMDAALCRARRLKHKLAAGRPILSLNEKKERKPMRRAP